MTVITVLFVAAVIWLAGFLWGRWYRPDPDDVSPRHPEHWAASRTGSG